MLKLKKNNSGAKGLRLSSSFLHLLPRRPVTSIPPFIFPSITRCRRQFLRKMWPIQLAFLLLISCRIFLCSLTLNTLLHFSYDRSNWSFPSLSSTTFQNVPGVSDLLPASSKFQHHIKLCSKCSTSLASSPNLLPNCIWRHSLYLSRLRYTVSFCRSTWPPHCCLL